MAANPYDLETKLVDIQAKTEAIWKQAEVQGRDMTTAEATEFDTLTAEFKATEEQLKRQRNFDEMNSTFRGTGRRTTPEGPGSSRGDRDASGTGALDATARAQMQRQPYQGRRFVELFGHADRSDFKSPEEFISIVANNQFDPHLIRAEGMREETGSTGGFLVPVQFARDILDRALEQSVMWGRVRVEPMTTNQLSISSFGSNDHSTGKPCGLQPEWEGEAQTFSEQVARVRAILLKAQKCGVLVPFSVELGEDSPNFAASLQTAVSEAIAWGIDDTILQGTGVGQPLGILNSSVTVSVAKESGQLADTILYQNIVKMYARLHPASVTSSLWLTNPSTLTQLLTMAVPVKNVAGTENVGGSWLPVLTEQSGTYSLLGRPLLLTEKAPTLGDKGDIMLVDPRQYVVGLRRNTDSP